MHFTLRVVALVVLIALINFALFCSPPNASSQNDGGYSRMLKEAQDKLKVTTLGSARLVQLLGDDYYYNREAASKELQRRGVEEFEAVYSAAGSAEPEVRNRAGRLLGGISGQAHFEYLQKNDPVVTLKLSNPRFWSGNNPYRGGLPDMSVDVDVSIVSSIPLEEVTSPLRLKSGKTNAGESVETLIWSSSSTATTSGVTYMTRPVGEFQQIEAELEVRGRFKLPGVKTKKDLTPGKATITEKWVWYEITKEKDGGKLVLCISDMFARLEKAEVKLLDKDGSSSKAPMAASLGTFRRSWTISPKEDKDFPTQFEFSVPGPRYYLERNIKVTIPRPR